MNAVATKTSTAGMVSKPKPPARGRETAELFERAFKGDETCLPEIRVLLADGERGKIFREGYGSSAEWLRRSIIDKAAGENVIAQEAIKQELDRVASELEGPNPTPIERLLAQRASLCWFILHWYENGYASGDGWTIAQLDFHQRRIDKAHRRFLTAVRTLAQVRKLALPTVQLNIARNQVNVLEAGS